MPTIIYRLLLSKDCRRNPFVWSKFRKNFERKITQFISGVIRGNVFRGIPITILRQTWAIFFGETHSIVRVYESEEILGFPGKVYQLIFRNFRKNLWIISKRNSWRNLWSNFWWCPFGNNWLSYYKKKKQFSIVGVFFRVK